MPFPQQASASIEMTESFDAPLINVEGSAANFEGRFEMLAKAIEQTIANIKVAAEAPSA
jgi:hypothetical protein